MKGQQKSEDSVVQTRIVKTCQMVKRKKSGGAISAMKRSHNSDDSGHVLDGDALEWLLDSCSSAQVCSNADVMCQRYLPM